MFDLRTSLGSWKSATHPFSIQDAHRFSFKTNRRNISSHAWAWLEMLLFCYDKLASAFRFSAFSTSSFKICKRTYARFSCTCVLTIGVVVGKVCRCALPVKFHVCGLRSCYFATVTMGPNVSKVFSCALGKYATFRTGNCYFATASRF